ncbi:hypothetical protein A2V82_14355 [candidate division KSB1 bacterium RBG_16_48_16]|nr:MAG: hypothetical protein A2V82_14355 [candidate division KSB1 bacterium RBG_16_48_16]
MKPGMNNPNKYTTLELRRIAYLLHQLVKYADLFGFGEDFDLYFKRLNSPKGAEIFLRHILNLLRIARAPIYGKSILDAGCGFGMTSLALRLLGAQRVVGIDLKRERLDIFCRMLNSLPFAIDGISMHNMSVTDMAFRDQSFDMILVNEAISHYNDVGRFFNESQRILTPGGVLIVSDGNNYSNPLLRRKNIKLWQTLEQGPDGITVWGHRIEKSLKTQRGEIIADFCPGLHKNEVDMLAATTSGLYGTRLLDAVRRYVATGKKPRQPYSRGRCPRNPVLGTLMEMAFDPYELMRRMSPLGFDVRVHSHFFGARGSLLYYFNRLLSYLSPVTIYGARAFRIVATKA